jgi:Ca2+-binding EF-hand superfamily protein
MCFSGSDPSDFDRKFAMMDLDDDGRISKSEMKIYMKYETM